MVLGPVGDSRGAQESRAAGAGEASKLVGPSRRRRWRRVRAGPDLQERLFCAFRRVGWILHRQALFYRRKRCFPVCSLAQLDVLCRADGWQRRRNPRTRRYPCALVARILGRASWTLDASRSFVLSCQCFLVIVSHSAKRHCWSRSSGWRGKD